MKTEHGKGEKTGQNSRSDRSSLGDKLKTEQTAKKSSGEKLKNEKASQASAGEKLRFDKAASCAESKNIEKCRSHGRNTPVNQRTITVITDQAHSKLDQDSDDNAGTDALNRGSQLGEHAATGGSNAVSRWKQKQAIKKEYAAARAGQTTGNAAASAAASGRNAAKETEKAAKRTRIIAERIRRYVSNHKVFLLIGGILLLLILLISGFVGSGAVMFQGGTNVILDTSYTADDEDILGAEADYCALESALQRRLDNIRSEYPGYDEYNITQDQIGHNPYELASILTVLFENYTRTEVQYTLRTLFAEQYVFTINETVETRYRTESRTGTYTVYHEAIDPDTGETITVATQEYYMYQVSVPYDYRILNVDLDNRGLGVSVSGLSSDQAERYAILMQTLGNRPDLFADNPYAIAVQDVLHYDIPGEALTDVRFARMIHEAEKYLGYPYVWGGSSPSTSFDCSGYVSWVINNCGNGWSVGRLTCGGLMDVCSIIPASAAKPGDLIFFQGTYDCTGPSHVGIYVGNNMMIHCGNPIQYASINIPYWQAHFYSFGRLP